MLAGLKACATRGVGTVQGHYHRLMFGRPLLAACFFSIVTTTPATLFAGQHWPQFRGPNGTAIADGARLPNTWSRAEKVAWTVTIAGTGWSSSIVWAGRVYVTSAITEGDYLPPSPGIFGMELYNRLRDEGLSEAEADAAVVERDVQRTVADSPPVRWMLHSLDATTGRFLWSQELHRGQAPGGRHRKNSYASQTPVTDGERVYVYIGNVGLFVTTMSGDLVWSNRFDPYSMHLDFGTAASVAVDDERVYVLHDNLERPFLAALDKGSGAELWTVEREAGPAMVPSGWSSPFVWRHALRTELITVGLGYAISYDADGHELWRLGGLVTQPMPTPIADDRFLYVGTGAQGGPNRPLYAVRPGASGDITLADGETAKAFVAWFQQTATPYVPSPLVYRGRVYSIFDNGILNVFDAGTGSRVYRARVGEGGSTFSASPWAADGKVYLLSEEGDTFVIAAGDEYRELAVNSLDELAFASPAVAAGALFIRTMTKLYRIQAPR